MNPQTPGTDAAAAEVGRRALVGRLAPGALHELANPLIALTGTTELLLAAEGEPDRDRLELLQRTADEMAELVRTLQGLVRELLHGELDLALGDFVVETAALVRRLVAIRDVGLVERVAGDAVVTARPAELRVVVGTALLDALESAQAGDVVEVRVDGAAVHVDRADATADDPGVQAAARLVGAELVSGADSLTIRF